MGTRPVALCVPPKPHQRSCASGWRNGVTERLLEFFQCHLSSVVSLASSASFHLPADVTFAPALSFFSGNKSFGEIFGSYTRLKKPTIISSQLCCPQITVFVGSGFSRLFLELSKWAVHSMRLPGGRLMGSARLYQSCQCQLYWGTRRIVRVSPFGNTTRYSKSFPLA